MKRSNRLVILVGVLLAVLAFVAIVILLNSTDPNAGPIEEETATVLVASRAIERGESVTPDLVETREVDPEAVQGTPLTDPSAVSGQPALFPIPADSQISAETIGIGTEAVTDIAALLDPGEKAIAFQVDRVTGVDFLVKPGDSIDVVVSQDVAAVQETADSAANADPEAQPRFEPVPGLANQRSVKAILQNKRVLYVSSTRAIQPEPVDTNGDGVIDANDQQPEQAAEEIVIIVFAGTDQDAEIVKFAQGQDASLTAVIRHAEDEDREETLGITIRQLVDEFGLLVPNVVQLDFETAE